MCGIAGIHIKRPGSLDGHKLERLVDELALGIEHRGRHATGVVAASCGGSVVSLDKLNVPAAAFIKIRRALPENLRSVLVHTRFATQGAPEQGENNHPVLHRTCFVTHNGHINNDSRLYQEYGWQRVAEVDSISIAAMLSEKGFDDAKSAFEALEGGFAVACIDSEQPDRLILAKGESSPLVFFENGDFIVWASTYEAIRDAWGRVLGTPPAFDKFRRLTEGQILEFDGEMRKLHNFTVADSWSGFNGCGTGFTGSTLRTNYGTKCVCGHSRFWHGSIGSSYTSPCERTEGRGSDAEGCDCEAFLDPDEALADSGSAFITCDGCYEWTNAMELEELSRSNGGESYYLCTDCAKFEWGESDFEPLADDYRGANAASLALVSDPGTPVGNALPTIRPPAPKVTGTPNTNKPNPDEVTHHAALLMVEEETGYNVAFIDWILFNADMDVLHSDDWLGEAFEKCDLIYAYSERLLMKTAASDGIAV